MHLKSTGLISENRRARYEYELLDEWQVGIILQGSEVKSLRAGNVRLQESYAGEHRGELCLMNLHIGPYANAPRKFQHDPVRPRRLLMHKRERNRILGRIKQDRLTLVPLKLYFSDRGLVKVDLALGKGKRLVDKRETIKERDWQRRKSRILSNDAS